MTKKVSIRSTRQHSVVPRGSYFDENTELLGEGSRDLAFEAATAMVLDPSHISSAFSSKYDPRGTTEC